MKSLYFLLFFIIIFYIIYKYAYKIYYKDKTVYKIKYLLPEISYKDYFKNQNLNKLYYDLFNTNLNIYDNEPVFTREDIKSNKIEVPQQFFLDF